MMKKLILVMAIALFPVISEAIEIEGTVVANYDMIFLVETDERDLLGVHILQAHKKYPDARLVNADKVHDVRVGDHLKIKGKEMEGMVVADEVEAEPLYELDRAVEIRPGKVRRLRKSGEDIVFIDTRPREIFESGHIPSALSMPKFDSSVLPDKEDELIVFYSSGNRDHSALESANMAISLGLTNVKVLSGGMRAWVDSGFHSEALSAYVTRLTNGDIPYVLIDTRSVKAFEEGHIPGAVSIPSEEISEDNVLQMSPYRIVLYGEDSGDADALDAIKKVASWSYGWHSSAPLNLLEGGYVAWLEHGGGSETGESVDPQDILPQGALTMDEFRKMWNERDPDKYFLDVRKGRPKHMDNIEFVSHIPIQDFPFRMEEIPRDKEVIIFCSVGYRSRIAYTVLKRAGYDVRYLNRKPPIKPDGTLE